MPVEASEFMETANGFMGQEGATEIQCRNAGSRAYYALIHAALNTIERKGLTLVKVQSAGSHESVIATLCSMGHSAKSISERAPTNPLPALRIQCCPYCPSSPCRAG